MRARMRMHVHIHTHTQIHIRIHIHMHMHMHVHIEMHVGRLPNYARLCRLVFATTRAHKGRTPWAHKGCQEVGAQGRRRTGAASGKGAQRPARGLAAQGHTAGGHTRAHKAGPQVGAQGPCKGERGEFARVWVASRHGAGRAQEGGGRTKAARAVGEQGWARTWTSGGRTRRLLGATAGWAHTAWPGRGAQGKDAVGAQGRTRASRWLVPAGGSANVRIH
jgi:hypothetical protein